jgi:16S rRNA (guanine527-N7)-methyltransferase
VSRLSVNSVELARRVATVVAALGGGLGAGAAESARIWLETLITWNARIDLTAARDPDELVDLMLADALLLAPRLPAGARVVDVGSGAGGPGLGLALARPDIALTLVEPLQKRVGFLRTVVGTLGITHVQVLRARGEELAPNPPFDLALGRAVMAPEAWLALGSSLVAPAGAVWVLLAREPPPTLLGWEVREDLAYEWPLTGVLRRAVRYEKLARPEGACERSTTP